VILIPLQKISNAILKRQQKNRTINAAVLFLHYYRSKYKNSFEKIKSYVDKIDKCNATYFKIDNYFENKTLYKSDDNTYEIGGDNSEREFSGWQKGLEALRSTNTPYDVIVFINEAFTLYGKSILDREDVRSIIENSINTNSVVGRFDNGKEKFTLSGSDVSEWICTNCFIIPREIMDKIKNIVSVKKENLNIFFDDNKLEFKENAPMSESFKKHITEWLTIDWHSKIEINDATWDLFKNKTLAILNEALFTAKLKESGIKIMAIKN